MSNNIVINAVTTLGSNMKLTKLFLDLMKILLPLYEYLLFLFFILFALSRNIKFNNRYSYRGSNIFIRSRNCFVNLILDPNVVTA
jgi:hypothetical protein